MEDEKVLLVMSQEKWYDHAINKGTSGDMVISILFDWKREREYLLSHISVLEGKLRLQQSAIDRWVPCPDHRDKVKSQCYVCENEYLEGKLAQALTAKQILERASLDADDRIQELREGIEEWQNKYLEAGEIIQHLRMEIFELKQLKEGKG